MANTFSNLVPDAYVALDVVSRELTGFIQSVTRDPKADKVATGQSVRSPVVPANTAGGDITPGMSLATAAYQTITNVPITITKARFMPFSWQGEEMYSLDQGPGNLTINQQQIAQAIRALVNEMEVDLAVAAVAGGSRAYGAVSTIPFTTNLAESAQMNKILTDNGAPPDRSLVISTTTGAALRTLLNNPLNANTSLNTDATRQGVLLDSNGFKIRESAQIPTVTAGAMTGALVNGALSAGATSIVFDTGTVNTTGIVAGDILTIGSHKYVVTTGSTSTSGTLVIAAPGLQAAVVDNATITVIATGARNVALSRNAMILATRLPESPKRDLATMREVITDDRTGLSFELVEWPGLDMVTYHVRACWGTKVLKPEHIGLLLQ